MTNEAPKFGGHLRFWERWFGPVEVHEARRIFNLVLEGKKPSALFQSTIITQRDISELERLDCEVVPVVPTHEEDRGPDAYAIALEGKKFPEGDVQKQTQELIKKFSDNPAFQAELSSLIEQTSGKSLAETLGAAHQGATSGERSAVHAALEGIALGYMACDVEYFVRTRYFDESTRYEPENSDPQYGHAICKKCAIALGLRNG